MDLEGSIEQSRWFAVLRQKVLFLVIWVTEANRQPIGYIDKLSATPLLRLMDDHRIFPLLQLTAGIPVELIDQVSVADFFILQNSPSTTLPLFISIFGPDEHEGVLRSVLAFHTIFLENYDEALERAQQPELPPSHPPTMGTQRHRPSPLGPTSLQPHFHPHLKSHHQFPPPQLLPSYSSNNFAFYQQNQIASTQVSSADHIRHQIDSLLTSLKSAISLPCTEPGVNLTSKLYKHQKMALTFMLERELSSQARQHHAILPSIWRQLSNRGVYQNLLTEEQCTSLPDESRGGILADDVRVFCFRL